MNSPTPEARAQTLILWASLIAGVALVILMIDLRTKQDLLEVYRHEQAKRGNDRGPGSTGRDLVDGTPRTPPAAAPHAPGIDVGVDLPENLAQDRTVGDA